MEKVSTFLVLLVIVGGATVLEATYVPNVNYRLPDDVVPKRYSLEIQPDLLNDTFNGSVAIEINVLRTTRSVTLHKRLLEIDQVSVSVLESDGSDVKIANLTKDKINETFTIHTQDELKEGRSYLLIIGSFKGFLTATAGFYSASYISEKGEKKKYAITDFQPTNARQAFPCFDEPGLKAKFHVSLIRPENYTSVANEKLESSVRLQNGWYKDIYSETPVMSTSMVTFAVSDFEVSTLKNLRIYGRPETIKKNGYELALRTSKKVLDILENLTGIAYASDKLDQFAVPDEGYYKGPMENCGVLTYLESNLFCTNSSTDDEIQTSTAVIAHKLTHQWFGNLVSPRWWNSIWLNEGFARYLQYYVVSLIHPSWRYMDQYIVIQFYNAMVADSYNYLSTLTLGMNYLDKKDSYLIYDKGSVVIHMMRNFLTHSVFIEGLRDYLNAHKFSTANSTDLFQAFQHAAARSNVANHLGNMTLEQIMDNWINKPGFPLITVNRNYTTGDITFSQKQLEMEENLPEEEERTIWHVPVNYAFRSDSPEKFNTTVPDFWLSERSCTFSMAVNTTRDDWLLVNIQQSGMYRVNYDSENWDRLIAHLHSDRYEDIPALNRAQLINDAFQLANMEMLPPFVPLKLSTYLTRERDYLPIYAFMSFKLPIQRYFRDLFMKKKYEKIKEFWPEYSADFVEPVEFASAETSMNFFSYLFKHIYQELGIRQRANDTYLEKHIRVLILHTICHTISECKTDLLREFDKIKATGNVNIVDRNLQQLIFNEAATNDSGKRYLLELYAENKDHFVRKRISAALKSYQFRPNEYRGYF